MTAPWFVWLLLLLGGVVAGALVALAWLASMERAESSRADCLLDAEPLPSRIPGPHAFDPDACQMCADIAASARSGQRSFQEASARIRRLMQEEAVKQCTWSESDDAAVEQLLGGGS